jgi:heme oxygenase
MKINRLFTFDVQLIHDLNAEVSKGFRSKFVNSALAEKLYDNVPTLKTATGRQLIAASLSRDDVSDFVKRIIKSELGIEE